MNQFNLSSFNRLINLSNKLFNTNTFANIEQKTNSSLTNIDSIKDKIGGQAKQMVIDKASNQNLAFLTSGFLNHYFLLIRNLFLTVNCFISKPIYELTPTQLTIKLFYYYVPTNGNNKNLILSSYIIKQIKFLTYILSKQCNLNICLQLTAIKVPQLEINILANIISIITNRLHNNFRKTILNVINNSMIFNSYQLLNNLTPAGFGSNKNIAVLTGIHFKLAGRLARDKIIPRRTVKTLQFGNLSKNYTNFDTIAKFTAKNRKGVFCYTLTMGHKFY